MQNIPIEELSIVGPPKRPGVPPFLKDRVILIKEVLTIHLGGNSWSELDALILSSLEELMEWTKRQEISKAQDRNWFVLQVYYLIFSLFEGHEKWLPPTFHEELEGWTLAVVADTWGTVQAYLKAEPSKVHARLFKISQDFEGITQLYLLSHKKLRDQIRSQIFEKLVASPEFSHLCPEFILPDLRSS